MPCITTENVRQFGPDSIRVLYYISLRRALLAVGGIQLCFAVVFAVAAGILGFGVFGWITVSALAISGIFGIVFWRICQPVDAPFVLARRIKRIKMITGFHIFLLALVLVIALLNVAWEFWRIIESNKVPPPPPDPSDSDHSKFKDAFQIVMCMAVVLLSAIPMCTFGLNLREISSQKVELRDG